MGKESRMYSECEYERIRKKYLIGKIRCLVYRIDKRMDDRDFFNLKDELISLLEDI